MKIIENEKLQFFRDKNECNIIFTNGCFDILHIGHIRLLEYCNSLKSKKKDKVVVGINSDNSIKKIKGLDRPYNQLHIRTEFLESISYVDFIYVFDEGSVLNTIKLIRPDILVKGGSTDEIIGSDFVNNYGGKVKKFKKIADYSSSKIAKRLGL